MENSLLGIPSYGWIPILFWLFIIFFPWVYSLVLMNKIDKSGVERWGAKKNNKN